MISYFAHIPNSVVILPAISKEKAGEFSKILLALKKTAAEIIAAAAEIVVVLIPDYGQNSLAPAIIANSGPQLTTDFSDLGDWETKIKIKGESVLAAKITHALYPRFPFKLETREAMKNADALLASLLAKKFVGRLLPIFLPALPDEELIAFAQALGELLQAEKEKIAVIAGGNFRNDAAGGELEKLAQSAAAALKKNDIKKIMATAGTAAEFDSAPLLALLAMAQDLSLARAKISYEQKYDTGFLVARLPLNL